MSYARTNVVLFLLLAVTLQSGCRINRRNNCTIACPRIADSTIAVPTSAAAAGVTEDFASVGGFAGSQVVTVSGTSTKHILTLEETLCVAAQNSRTAQLLESQIRKLNATPNLKCPGSLNLAISAEIAEERTTAASLAGQAFLGLVEIELQRKLLVEAQEKLVEINRTVQEANNEGFATAQAKEIIAEQTIEVAKRESEINFNALKLESQLKALLSLPSTDGIELSYDLRPNPISLELESQKSLAFSNRASLLALQKTLSQWNSCSAEAAKTVLSAADPRMGAELVKAVVKRRWPILARFLPAPPQPQSDPCENDLLRQQTEKLLVDSQDAVGLQVEQALYEIQYAYETMTLANDEIVRLEDQVERITAQRDRDATQAYIDLQNNWYETLLARSKRLSKAIEFETAQIRLAEATGELLQICGLQFESCLTNGL